MSEMKRPLRVFLYHAPGDRDDARALYLRLLQDGVDAWLVKDKLLPEQDWKDELRQAVHEADVVAVCLSGRFHRGEFQKKDMQTAFNKVIEQDVKASLFIAVRLEECDRHENMERWQGVDLFEEAGYEILMHALQSRADVVGAMIQKKEGSLLQTTTSGANGEESLPEENPVEPLQGILIHGAGILIEGAAVELQRQPSLRKIGRALRVALMSLIGVLVVVVYGPPQLEDLYFAVLFGDISGSATAIVTNPLIKAAHANIVFVVDASDGMKDRKIEIVKSALPNFISHLDERYLSSVIKFDTRVELQNDLTHEHADTSDAVKSLTINFTEYGSCTRDALYAGVEQAALVPVAKDTKNVVILLTDNAYESKFGPNCSVHDTDDVLDLAEKYSVSIFIVRIAGQFIESGFRELATQSGGALLNADNREQLASVLPLMADMAGLKLHTEQTARSLPLAAEPERAPMVFVPPGKFIMGNNHTVFLQSFWIDKTEVTNTMYAKCVQAGKCGAPHSNASKTRENYYGNPAFANYPVVFVSWGDAHSYCTWAGGRLPTEAEWEKAARGTDGRSFPWGDKDPSGTLDLLNYRGQNTMEVGNHSKGASPYGALDMAGNVAEWVADWFSLGYYLNPPAFNPLGPDSGEYRVWRGGSWADSSSDWVRTYSRSGNLPTDSNPVIGFRCARDAAP